MNTLEMARAAGFVILLDGKIGRETYHSVIGSLSTLERFQALCREGRCETIGAGGAAVTSDDATDILPPGKEGRGS
ncbi:hypothetical protein LJR230_002128 [Trinickia sp. LjRoot230]|uniref:hypothetical protein n=1 Tax=Trinickia sp. LjRoot230 TaxID=3342288 RepID=UPI003ECFE6E7